MSALNPILSKLAISKIEIVGEDAVAPQAKDLEALFLERGFIALLGVMQHGVEPSCGGCPTSCSSGGPACCCCLPCC